VSTSRLLLVAAVAVAFAGPVSATDLNQPPINYETATPDNAVTRVQKEIAAGRVTLAHTDDHGYLRSVLKAFNIPESSQVLVFSKTSAQRSRIGPRTPRAVYFNDDVYVGFCLRGDVLELSVADPLLGTNFYTLDQEPAGRPRFARNTEQCLICHASSANRGVPGHLLRSVYPDRGGEPIFGSGTYRTDDTSPFRERWGGWYVTGRHGGLEHLGNRTYRGRRDYEDDRTEPASQNVTDLRPFFTAAAYPTPHSDVVALLVLGHQVAVHNRIARATLETRAALHYQDELNKALKEPPGTQYESVKGRIASVGDDLVKALLFCGEAKLTDRVEGTTTFARDFTARGPADARGRSLREFDLRTRMFKYPCSFLVYTESFDRMPAAVRDYALRKMFDVLTAANPGPAFTHLSAADRAAVLDILRATKPNLPAYWRG
jgi:hypothetical protein